MTTGSVLTIGSSGLPVGSLANVSTTGAISGYVGNINYQVGTTYTLVGGNTGDTGKIISHTNASAITVTLPNSLPAGFCCTYVQMGAGQITFSPASGAALHNKYSHTKTAGQYSGVMIYINTNSGGTSADYLLMGDTG